MKGYIYIPLLLVVLIALGFVLSGGFILSKRNSSATKSSELYKLVDKEADLSNPTLQLSALEFAPQSFPQVFCGGSGSYDIALVFDNSDSITTVSSYLKTTKDAMISFVDAFSGTSTQFSVTKFSTTAEIIQSFTYDMDEVKSAINSIDKDNSINGGLTNWQDGLTKTKETLDSPSNRPSVPDFVVFASDGEPNRIGEDGRITSLGDAVDKAVEVAGTIRENAEIFALGIGSGLNDSAGTNIQNLMKITGSTEDGLYRFRLSRIPPKHVILTDFDKLGADIAKVTVGICEP